MNVRLFGLVGVSVPVFACPMMKLKICGVADLSRTYRKLLFETAISPPTAVAAGVVVHMSARLPLVSIAYSRTLPVASRAYATLLGVSVLLQVLPPPPVPHTVVAAGLNSAGWLPSPPLPGLPVIPAPPRGPQVLPPQPAMERPATTSRMTK